MLTLEPTQRIDLTTLLAIPWLAAPSGILHETPAGIGPTGIGRAAPSGIAQASPSGIGPLKRRYGVTHQVPEPGLLRALESRFGLKASYVAASLRDDLFNHATASYALLEEEGECVY